MERKMSKIHKSEFRVYYEDTDAGGIMYHGNYISFCERARSDMLRDFGSPASEITKELGVAFVVRHLDAEYLAMAHLDDLLTVETTLKTIKNSSFIMKQSIKCQNIAVFSMDVTLVCVDMAGGDVMGKPVRTPQKLRDKFKDYLEG